jgi:GNAT superfamily N-acetyltransferase
MKPEDSAVVADLCGQLGYPATPDQVLERIGRVERLTRAALFVGEEEGRVIGWIHVAIIQVLEADLYAEIGGLVVDSGHRSRGAGGVLVDAAEEWARSQGCGAMRVRSRIMRERAHAFYERLGYARIKTQHSFEKRLT